MPTLKKKRDFFTSEEGIWAFETLNSMVWDDKYKTVSAFTADTKRYPDNMMPFTDKHMYYLQNHANTDPKHYLANLKMMTRIR